MNHSTPQQEALRDSMLARLHAPSMDRTTPWTHEHCRSYPRQAAQEIAHLRGQLANAQRAVENQRQTIQWFIDLGDAHPVFKIGVRVSPITGTKSWTVLASSFEHLPEGVHNLVVQTVRTCT